MRLFALAVLGLVASSAGAADPPAKLDRYGDPLPAGALMRLGTLRTRAPISGFGIEKDGTVVTVSPGGEVRRWKPDSDRSGEPIPLPVPDTKRPFAAPQVSPDGRRVAACSAEQVFVWEVPADAKAKPKQVAAFELASPRVFRFSDDGNTLVVITDGNGTTDGVHLCDLKRQAVTALDTGGRYARNVTFSGDGTRLGAAVDDDFVLWDATTGKQLGRHAANGRLSEPLALNSAGDTLAARYDYSGPEERFRFTDPVTGQKRDGLAGPKGAFWVSYAADGKTLLVGDRSGIRWWDPAANKLIRRFDGVAHGYSSHPVPARFTPDGKVLVFQNGYVLLRWDAATGKPLFPGQGVGHGSFVNGLGVSPDGKRFATRGMDNRVCVWDAATGQQLWHAPAEWTNAPEVDFSPDGKFVYFAGPDWDAATKYDAETGKAVRSYQVDPEEPKQAGAYSVRASADGKTVFALTGPYTVGDPHVVTAWDAATGERKKSSRVKLPIPGGGELSPDGLYVAAGWGGAGVRAVAAPDRDLLADAKGGRRFHVGNFSDDGKWLAVVGSADVNGAPQPAAVLIEVGAWRPVSTIPLADSGFAAVAPDGRTLAAAAGDAIEFYDATTLKLLARHRLPAAEVRHALGRHTFALRFTPDGKKLITGHADTTALVWAVPERPVK